MSTTDGKTHRLMDTVLPLLLCLCFIASSLSFLVQTIIENQVENAEYLYDASDQKKATIVKQAQDDLQTLEGPEIMLGGVDESGRERLLPILHDINNEDAFVHMGFTRLDKDAWFMDLNGEAYGHNLKDMEFFQKVLQGKNNIPDVFSDDLQEGQYINYYGMGIRTPAEGTIGVLCVVHTADVLRSILDAPILNGQGFSNIISSSGDYIMRSTYVLPGGILPENKEALRKAIEEDGTGSFEITDKYGREQVSVIVPLSKGRWYLHSMVPQSVLRARYIETTMGAMTIIVAAYCLFALFISRQRSMTIRAQKMLMDLAYDDRLTSLRNYDGFRVDARQFLGRDGLSSCILWYGDLRKFKFVSDILGYEGGDKVPRIISEYLMDKESRDCISYRMSADNFAGICRCENQELFMEQVLSLNRYIKDSGVEGQNFIELSIDVYWLAPGDSEISIDVLVNYANMARKIAKERPGSSCALYDDEIRQQRIEDSLMKAEVKKALRAGEFKVYMQPRVNVRNHNRIAGAETLVRWLSPSKGLIPPASFIPPFEKNNRIILLDRYMFEQTCGWFERHLNRDGSPINLTINMLKVGLLRKDLIEYYAKTRQKYRLPDGYLELEFTEGILLDGMDLFSDTVKRFQSKGFICSLGDFGSDYNSLNLLKNLPIDVLKLDITFFHRSEDSEKERIVVSNFIHMAKELRIKTITEGVESMKSVDFLKSYGCDVVQGYAFFKPMSLGDFEHLVNELGDRQLEPGGV